MISYSPIFSSVLEPFRAKETDNAINKRWSSTCVIRKFRITNYHPLSKARPKSIPRTSRKLYKGAGRIDVQLVQILHRLNTMMKRKHLPGQREEIVLFALSSDSHLCQPLRFRNIYHKKIGIFY